MTQLRGLSLGFLVVCVGVGAEGCLLAPLEIPCERDDQCPSGGFCDVSGGACVVDGTTAPDLNILRVRDQRGAIVIDPFVPGGGERTELFAVLENKGDLPAEGVRLSFIELACMGLDFDPTVVPDVVDAGGSVEVAFSVAPVDCVTPSIQDWFLFYSGRSKRGTFNINVERADFE